MQNIDPVYFLYPIIVITFSFGTVIYWHFNRSFSRWALTYSLVAYAAAIALKYLVQIPTFHTFDTVVGGNLFALGIYYGLQTVLFEILGAYIVARYAFSRSHFKASDAEGYGLGLAMWENGVLIGVVALINFISYYAILSSGTSNTSLLVYDSLTKNSPALFNPPATALPLVGLDILERVSSFLAHFSWGYLCVLSVVLKRRLFLAAAVPMGLIDFFVVFSPEIGIARFELLIFGLSLVCLAVALGITKSTRRREIQGPHIR